MAIYLVISDMDTKHVLLLGDRSISVGRSSKARLKIASTTASGVHCSFKVKDHKVVVKDLNSKNGTFINGYKISESYLYIGDKVKIGNAYAQLDSKEMNQIERAANTRVEQAVKANEVEIGGNQASRSVKMLTAIHNLETANIQVDKKEERVVKKKKTKKPAPKPKIKQKPKKKGLFAWLAGLFSGPDED